jgi:transcriptional regulator with XRE-family HTH domain
MFVKISNENELKEESFLNILDKQYLEADNKEKIDYWTPLTKIIMESIELRDLKGMSQTDLSERMKTRQSVISRFENMGRLPNYDFIVRLALALEHVPGMTLYGDYMAVVPIEKQSLIKKLAQKENTSTSKFVQNLLNQGITKKSICDESSRMLYATPEILSGIENSNKSQLGFIKAVTA